MLSIKILPAAKLPLGARKVKRGAYGADVKELQELLAQRGFFPAEPNGSYGYVTDEAVREFQAAHRLRCDGIAGPKVIEALLGTAHTGGSIDPQTHTPPHTSTPNFGEVYAVTHEKSLGEVAAKLAIPVVSLASSNRISVSAAVYPGQRLKINRRILGAWLEKGGTRTCLRKDFPALSLLVYPAATIEAGGSLVQSSAFGALPMLQAGSAETTRPAFVAALGNPDATLWQRFLKRRDWWKTWAASCREGTPVIAFETVAPRQSERRRIMRFLRFLSSSRSKNGPTRRSSDLCCFFLYSEWCQTCCSDRLAATACQAL